MHASSGWFRRWCLRDSSPIVQHGPEGCTISVKVRKCRHWQGELARWGAQAVGEAAALMVRLEPSALNLNRALCVRALAPT